jgi:sugar lactone lactonase YvrE
MTRSISVAFAGEDVLGEGPVWDDRTGRLGWVDIKSRALHAWRPGDPSRSTRTLPEEVSLALPRAYGGWVVTQVDRILVGEGDAWSTLCSLDSSNEHTRLNDGGCDDQGRLWVGTYSTRGLPEAALYCVDSDGSVHLALSEMVAANGLDWSPDGTLLHVADTGRCRIDSYTLDPADRAGTSLLRRATVFVEDGKQGRPDGMATDSEGGVWVAMWGGSHLRRYLPDGTLTDMVQLPVTFPTSVAFGGPDLATLYITTSRHHLDDPASEPQAGSLLAYAPEIRGLPTRRFGR